MIRKITGEESIFFRAPEANVSLVARLLGEVHIDELKNALMKVIEIHPLLSAHIVVDKNNDIFFDSKELTELPLTILPRFSDNQWETVIAKEFNTPFDFENGPLIRFILLKSTSCSDLLIFCQHLICDGLSLANLIDEILTLIGNPKHEYIIEKDVCLPTPENIVLPKESSKFESFIKKVIMSYINRKWKKTRIDFKGEDFLQIHKSFFEKYQYKIITTELLAEDTFKLIEICRENKVTVNSAISVAFLASRKDIINNYKNEFQGVAVSVRNRLKRPVDNAFGCFVSDIGFKYRYNEEHDFWDNVRSYHKNVKNEIETYKDLQSLKALSNMDYSLMEALTFSRHVNYNPDKYHNYQSLSKLIENNRHIASRLSKAGLTEYPGLLITNLGSLKYSTNYGNIKLDELYFAPSSIPTPAGGLIIGVVSMNNKLSISLNIMLQNGESEYFNLMNEININAMKYLKNIISC